MRIYDEVTSSIIYMAPFPLPISQCFCQSIRFIMCKLKSPLFRFAFVRFSSVQWNWNQTIKNIVLLLWMLLKSLRMIQYIKSEYVTSICMIIVLLQINASGIQINMHAVWYLFKIFSITNLHLCAFMCQVEFFFRPFGKILGLFR